MSDFLEQVIAERRAYVAEARERRPLPLPDLGGDLRLAGVGDAFTGDLVHAKNTQRIAVIAEVKRVSPALGRLAAEETPAEIQAQGYVAAGATALSVLTEPRHWGGSLEDLVRVRAAVGPRVPILCKDIVVDEYQIAEAAEAGASAVLLIAEALSDGELRALKLRASTLGLGVLVEAHEPGAFARAVATGAMVVGVNARDLRRPQEIDPRRVDALHSLVQSHQILVAESGIGSIDDVRRLPARVNAVLVGTALMRSADPGVLIREIAALEWSAT